MFTPKLGERIQFYGHVFCSGKVNILEDFASPKTWAFRNVFPKKNGVEGNAPK